MSLGSSRDCQELRELIKFIHFELISDELWLLLEVPVAASTIKYSLQLIYDDAPRNARSSRKLIKYSCRAIFDELWLLPGVPAMNSPNKSNIHNKFIYYEFVVAPQYQEQPESSDNFKNIRL